MIVKYFKSFNWVIKILVIYFLLIGLLYGVSFCRGHLFKQKGVDKTLRELPKEVWPQQNTRPRVVAESPLKKDNVKKIFKKNTIPINVQPILTKTDKQQLKQKNSRINPDILKESKTKNQEGFFKTIFSSSLIKSSNSKSAAIFPFPENNKK
jgi:hypothetical protein